MGRDAFRAAAEMPVVAEASEGGAEGAELAAVWLGAEGAEFAVVWLGAEGTELTAAWHGAEMRCAVLLVLSVRMVFEVLLARACSLAAVSCSSMFSSWKSRRMADEYAKAPAQDSTRVEQSKLRKNKGRCGFMVSGVGCGAPSL